ncbi:MAG: hypothetical protein AAFY29_01640 [Pseudomonadota bacterium]
MTDYLKQIPDYLANSLSKGDRDAFEIALLEDSELQSAVMIEKALKQGLGNLDGPSRVASKSPASSGIRSKVAARLALAASVCLGFVLYYSYFQESDSRISSIDQIVYVEPMRSKAATTYKIDADATTLLSVAVSNPAASEVTVAITGNGFTAPSETVAVSDDGLVNVVVPQLAPGTYQLTLKSSLFEDIYSLNLQ